MLTIKGFFNSLKKFFKKINEILFQSFPRDNIIFLYPGIYYELRKKVKSLIGIGVFFFFLLLVFPLILNFFNGTAFIVSISSSYATGSVCQKLLYFIFSIFPSKSTLEVAFINDYPFIIIGLLISFHSVVMYYVFDRISITFKNLVKEKILMISNSKYNNLVKKYNKIANSWYTTTLIIIISIYFTRQVYYWRIETSWWGNSVNGFLGTFTYSILAFIIIHQIVMYTIKGLFTVFLLLEIFRCEGCILNLQVFHPDRAHGVAGLGNIILCIWVGNLIHTTIIYILPLFNFVQFTLVFIILSIVVYAFIWPTVSYVPIFYIHNQMQKYKTINFDNINRKIQPQKLLLFDKLSIKEEDKIQNLNKDYMIIKDIKEYPFKYNLTAIGILLFYTLQVNVFIVELVYYFKLN